MGVRGRIDGVVPASEAAAFAGVSVQTVYNDHKRGAPGEDIDGHLYVPKAEYKAWRESFGQVKKGGGRPRGTGAAPAVLTTDDGETLSLAQIKLRQESVRLEAESLELEKAKGNLLEREDVEAAWGQLLQEIATTLDGLPAVVAAEAGKSGLSERQIEAVRVACEERVKYVGEMLKGGATVGA